MHEHGLAKELWPQLQHIAQQKGMTRVRRLEMTVGLLHGVSADFLAHSFEHAFEGSLFEGAEVKITIVEPGEEFFLRDDQSTTANGWEILVTAIEGDS
ncbi:MAG: hydrogenase nickel incorporation protein [Planctomycetes bacterium ADurb.Bin126]|nr:MAG: hydrogenase nickel incorporation protein [Planctomycetes bacterium ADurb.Bin126]HOD81302.1 hydrogenase/urease maturation nickel metallochaperone HypA [Phycisphaerae bacterium]HQL74121.1 hydrogenase/urease maturation nickel metallochaperone HypA [Phycisphaerae bacterium]